MAEQKKKAEAPAKKQDDKKAEAPAKKSGDWRKDYAKHPKFAKFQKGEK